MDNMVIEEIEPIVKIFEITDNYLKKVSELFGNPSSRQIIILLIDDEMYVNQISKKLEMRVSLVVYHLKKLEELGFLSITEKPISKKTKNHKYYKIKLQAFTVLLGRNDGTDKDTHKNNKLKKLFKDSVKFVGVGIAGITTWFTTNTLNNAHPDQRMFNNSFEFEHILFPALITTIVIGFGLIMIYCSKKHT